MLFDVTRGELVGIFGEDRLAALPATAFPPSAADTEGARLLQTVGVPTGTFSLREPDEDSGRLPLVQDVVDAKDFEDASEDAGDWPVIGWLLNAQGTASRPEGRPPYGGSGRRRRIACGGVAGPSGRTSTGGSVAWLARHEEAPGSAWGFLVGRRAWLCRQPAGVTSVSFQRWL
ncbi:SUKH-4 family immunity protein [Streptomyces europaeiscabiei]|uniref:SUKH-4 family immunity protein n=1 Tax=Streptomyces europaeiscabiei TaxID=146819 RepID=UPI0029BD3446|nr:SUKH-4 family immunity protein [Streptomyces europaeiscabiei]MDX3581275.1 SUKH-4 family immunity protein [Streptomyces europaeiscabiei]